MNAIFSNKFSRRSNVLIGTCVLLCTGAVTVACGGAELDVGERGDQLEDEGDNANSPSEVVDDDDASEFPTPQPADDTTSNVPTLNGPQPSPTALGPSPAPTLEPNTPTLDNLAPVAPTDDSAVPTPVAARDPDAPTFDTPATVCVACTGAETDPPDCQPACPQPVAGGGCGDGVLDGVEECDDGNLDDGDGCSASCQFE